MSPSAKRVLEEALHLPEAERASVAGALIESLHPDPAPGVDEAWEEVIARRVRALEEGTAKTIPWSEVKARLFSGFE